MVPQHICHTNPYTTANCGHLDQLASLSTANHDHQGYWQKAPLFSGQIVSVLNDARCLWLPTTVICAADHGSYIVQVISSGQYQCACDHICEHHLDAVKPDKHITTNVAPATPTHWPATQTVQPAPCVEPETPQSAAIPCTLWKTPTVHTPPHAQSVTLKLTGTALAVPHHSPWSHKPPSWLIEEMQTKIDHWWWTWWCPDLDHPWHMLEVNHDDVTGCPHAPTHNEVNCDDVTECPHVPCTN